MLADIVASFGLVGRVDSHGQIKSKDAAVKCNHPLRRVEAQNVHGAVDRDSDGKESLGKVAALAIVLLEREGLPR